MTPGKATTTPRKRKTAIKTPEPAAATPEALKTTDQTGTPDTTEEVIEGIPNATLIPSDVTASIDQTGTPDNLREPPEGNPDTTLTPSGIPITEEIRPKPHKPLIKLDKVKFRLNRMLAQFKDKKNFVNIVLLNRNGTMGWFTVNADEKTWGHNKHEYLLKTEKRHFWNGEVYYVFDEEKAEALPLRNNDGLDSVEFYGAINNKVIDQLNLLDKRDTIKATLILVFIILIMSSATLWYMHETYQEIMSLSEYLLSVTGR